MGARRPRLRTVAEPISAADVANLWKKTKKRGGQPNNESNEALAAVMNCNRVMQTSKPIDGDFLRALDVLIEDVDGLLVFAGSAEPLLKNLLDDLRPGVAAYTECSRNSWHPVAAYVVWVAAEAVLSGDLNEAAGTSRDSVAVKFTTAALHRMGYSWINEPGVEAIIKRFEVA